MPKVNGLEVLRQVKADDRLKVIPVVVFTSSFEESDLARTYRLGANAFVVKPVDFTQFVSTLNGLKSFWLNLNEPPPEDLSPNVSHTRERALALEAVSRRLLPAGADRLPRATKSTFCCSRTMPSMPN